MADIQHEIKIKAPLGKVLEALNKKNPWRSGMALRQWASPVNGNLSIRTA